MPAPVVLHIPHASVEIPAEWRAKILLDDAALRREVIRMTDMHTHALYDAAGAERVVMPVSRLLVDAERFSDDAQESMSRIGMGMIYTATSHLETLRAPPTAAERQALIDAYYAPHHDALNAAAARHLAARGYCLVVDCHSFPSKALPYEGRDPAEARAPVCIGTDAFHTPPWLAEHLRAFFTDRGYETAVDTPFAGALVPGNFYGKNAKVMSVMIEVRRDLYMDEATGEKNAGFDKIRNDLSAAIENLALVCHGRMK